MKDRRSLVEGLGSGSEVDRSLEEDFVYAGKTKENQPTQTQAPASEVEEAKRSASHAIGRVPLTTRVRSDFAAALKRASLQRQLDGVSPNTLQDILEEALEPWLRTHGYL